VTKGKGVLENEEKNGTHWETINNSTPSLQKIIHEANEEM